MLEHSHNITVQRQIPVSYTHLVHTKGRKLDTLEQLEIYKHTKTNKNDILNEQTQFKSNALFEHITPYTPVSYTHLYWLKWLEHLNQMDDCHIPKHLLNYKLTGQRGVWHLKKCWSDQLCLSAWYCIKLILV